VAGTANNYFARYNSVLYPPAGLVYRWTPPQCSGILAAATPTGLGLVCPGGTSTIGVTYTFSGVTYSWNSSTGSNLGPFAPILNANSAGYVTAPISQTTWYQMVSTCINSSSSATSTAFEVQVQSNVVSTVPYFEGFEGISVPGQLPNCSWLTTNTQVCLTYTSGAIYNRTPKSGTRFASFQAPTNSSGDYFFTNGIQLNAGVIYSAAVNYIADVQSGWSELSIMTGTAQNAAAMTNIVSEMPANSVSYHLVTNTFVVPSSGIYYVGIKSAGSSSPKYLSWDDLSITVPCDLNAPTMGISANSATMCTGQSVTSSQVAPIPIPGAMVARAIQPTSLRPLIPPILFLVPAHYRDAPR
jgi:hypothetical protein